MLDYCPFPLESDPRRFGLTTSSMRLTAGTVVVRHGRRTTSDTATILLHGAAGSWSTWTPFLTAAESVHAGPSDLVIPDLPGWGDTPLPVGTLTIDRMAASVAEIARALGYRRWRVIGHSMGGFIALHLAASEPRATTFVGLVSATTFSVIDTARHPLTRFATLPAYAALLQVMRMLRLLGPAGRALVRGLSRLGLLRGLVSPLFAAPHRVGASVIDALGREVRPDGFVLASAQAGGYDAQDSWRRITCPVRSVHGGSDVFVTGRDDGRLGGVIGDFAVRTVLGTGHFGHIERPLETLRGLALIANRE